MQRANGLSAHLVVGCELDSVLVTWFLNGQPIGRRRFADLGGAVSFSDRMKAQNWAVGWRLASDRDDAPPQSTAE